VSTTRQTPAAASTPRDVRCLKEDAQCWYEGYRSGRLGLSLFPCPYPTGTIESWSWTGGHIEGKARREKDERHA